LPALEQLPQQILDWAATSLGKDAETARFSQFPGGANNLVFGCETPASKVVVKAYPQATQRFQAEADFLAYANKVAAGYVPRLLETDTARRLLVMEYLEGARFDVDSVIERDDVERAAAFIGRLNTDPAQAAAQITLPAAEGFLELSQHAENVATRVSELTHRHLPQTYQDAAQRLVVDTKSRWEAISRALEAKLRDGAVSDTLPAANRCISPSDFGFHNALRCQDGLVFYDFEFAGWDDPAKTLVDFFLQPRIPVSREYEALFLPALSHNIPAAELGARADVLRPVLHLKWITIVLAVLRPARLQAILAVTVDKDVSTLIEERLARAQRLLSQGTI